jgi:hypothetical protein
MRKAPVTVALMLVATAMLTTGIASAAVVAKSPKLPKNACKLLTAAEVQTLVTDADAGTPKKESAGGAKSVRCYWRSTSDTNLASLTVQVLSLPPNYPPGFLKQALQSEDGAKKVSGIGSFAVVSSVVNVDVEVKAIVRGSLTFIVEYNATGAQDQQDAVIAAAKAGAKRVK